MICSKNIYKKENLLSILDLVLDYFIENEECYFCMVKEESPRYCLRGSDLCKSLIFEGLLQNVEKQEKKNAHK